jgi:hypothetical protein
MNTALECGTRVVQEGSRRCKKSTLNDLVHLTPLRIPLMNPPKVIVSAHSAGAYTATLLVMVNVTEYTELQPLLSGVHSVMRVKLVLAGEGGGCTPTPSHYIYPHQ